MDTKFIAPIALLVTGVAIFIVCNIIGFTGLLLLPPILLAVLLIGQPKRLLLALWIMTLFVPSLELIFEPFFIKLIEQGVGGVLLVVLLGDFILTRNITKGLKVVTGMVTVLLFVAGASAIVNKVPPLALLIYFLTYIKHIWIFYFAARFLTPADAKHVFGVGVVSFVIQIMANVLAYIGLNPLPLMLYRSFADFSVGTLGSSHRVGYFMAAFCMLLIAFGRHVKGLHKRALCLVTAAVALVQFYFCYPIHAYPLLAGTVGLQFIAVSTPQFGRRLRGVLAVVLLVTLTIVLVNQGVSVDLPGDLETDRGMQRNLDNMQHGLKIDAYREVFLNAGEHVNFPILGGGPGNYSSTTAFILQRPLSQLPHLFYLYTAANLREVQAGSIISLTRTGYIALYGELGPVGLLVYWGIYVYAALRIWNQWRRELYRDVYSRSLAETFVPSVAFFLVLNILVDGIPMYPVNIGLWIWAGVLWNPLPVEDHERSSLASREGNPGRTLA